MEQVFDFGFSAFGIVLSLVVLAGVIYTLVDAAPRPEPQWAAAGQQKTLWVVLLAVSIVLAFCCWPLGIISPAIYYFAIRPKLEAAKNAGGEGFAPPPPPPPGSPPPPPPPPGV